jgi:hypothetical protein
MDRLQLQPIGFIFQILLEERVTKYQAVQELVEAQVVAPFLQLLINLPVFHLL